MNCSWGVVYDARTATIILSIRWTQDDYHGLAAIFAKIEGAQVVRLKPTGSVIHPRTLEAARGRIPGEYFLAEDVHDGREELALWLTSPENPYFAKAIVNRWWQRLMGRGLVEPVDDFRATNPATHPALLDKLADDFVAQGYNLRHTLKLIVSTQAYARSADANPDNKTDDRFYSHATRASLEAEVLADAISDVLRCRRALRRPLDRNAGSGPGGSQDAIGVARYSGALWSR